MALSSSVIFCFQNLNPYLHNPFVCSDMQLELSLASSAGAPLFLASGEPGPSYTAYLLSSTCATHPRGNKDLELALDLTPWVFLGMGESDGLNAIAPNGKTWGFETHLVLRNC